VLGERNGRALIDAGLDELRVSLDAANRESFKAVVAGIISAASSALRAFRGSAAGGHAKRRFRVWLTGERDRRGTSGICEKLQPRSGQEVYLQRLVFFRRIRHRQGTAGSGAVSNA